MSCQHKGLNFAVLHCLEPWLWYCLCQSHKSFFYYIYGTSKLIITVWRAPGVPGLPLVLFLMSYSSLLIPSSKYVFLLPHQVPRAELVFWHVSFLWNSLLSLTKVTVHNFTPTGHTMAYPLPDQLSHQGFPQKQPKVLWMGKLSVVPSSPSLLQVRVLPQHSEGRVVLKLSCIHHFLQRAAYQINNRWGGYISVAEHTNK